MNVTANLFHCSNYETSWAKTKFPLIVPLTPASGGTGPVVFFSRAELSSTSHRDPSFFESLATRLRGLTRPSRGRSKILIHAINYAPELIGCAKYTTEFAQHLTREGHQVEVVTAPPHYPGWFARAPYSASAYSAETLDGVRVYRCPLLMKKNGGGFWRLLAPLTFALAAAPVVLWRILAFRPDTVMCVEPTLFSAPVAMLAAKAIGARTLLHVQDLEIDAAFAVGHMRGDALRKATAFLEAKLLDSFDSVVTISGKMREALCAKGLSGAKVSVLRNWVDLNAIRVRPRGAPNFFRRELKIADDQFVALYAGHIGVKQALTVVLDAARALVDEPRLRFVIAGEGPMKASLLEAYGSLPNVDFLPLQPVEKLEELLATADLHLLPQLAGAADLVLPSKLGGMLASGRLIAATVEPGTELAQLLDRVALLTPAGDAQALAQAIRKAQTMDPADYVARGMAIAESLDIQHALRRFETLLIGTEEKAAAPAVVEALAEAA